LQHIFPSNESRLRGQGGFTLVELLVVNAIIGLFREVKTVFQSHVLRPAIRELLEAGKFAELAARDTGIHSSLLKLEKGERENLLNYLQKSINLAGIEGVAQ
jgi:prepilin-type N-terminal cleavage/methylation domain-containing protein